MVTVPKRGGGKKERKAGRKEERKEERKERMKKVKKGLKKPCVYPRDMMACFSTYSVFGNLMIKS